uniref:Uncharacterized protein n=1 Tax=Eptatretus burgeri TaxID=7764 RepID=A0A8C4ND88_EPTBU
MRNAILKARRLRFVLWACPSPRSRIQTENSQRSSRVEMASTIPLLLVVLLCVNGHGHIVQKPVKASVPEWLVEQLKMNTNPSALKPDSDSCGLEPRTPKAQPPFPPGMPNEMNIAAICNTDRPPLDRGFVVPSSAFGFLRRRVEMLHSLNAAFSGCCSQDESQQLNCAAEAWINALIVFCDHETRVKDNIHQCCFEEGSAVHRCFARLAPDRDYTGASLDSVDDAPQIISTSFPRGG